MQTYYITDAQINNDTITVTGDLYHHISRVLRCKIGDTLRFSDTASEYFTAELTAMDSSCGEFTIITREQITDEPQLKVTLVQCMPRGEKLDSILKRCTELGVTTVIPCESGNSQIRIAGKEEKKRQRLQKLADAAAEQCGRGIIPEVVTPCKFKDALAQIPSEAKILFCYENEKQTGLKEILRSWKQQSVNHIALIIGPEGGFTPGEAQEVAQKGGIPVTLGTRILRVETAAPAALAALMYEFDEWEVRAADEN